jgi:hypothetical protein
MMSRIGYEVIAHKRGLEPIASASQNGGSQPLAVVDPENAPSNPLPPPVVIEETHVEGEHLENDGWQIEATQQTLLPANPRPYASHPAAIYPSSFNSGRPALRIPPGRRRLEFHYAGLSFTAPEKVRFRYKLDGLDQDWVEADTRRVAEYSFVPPGAYQFRVLACNNDGVWNESGAMLAVTVLPQFWQTWWFRALVASIVLLLFVAAYELRLAAERRVTRLRLRIARDLHDEIGSNLGSIALLSEVIPRPPASTADEVSEIRRIAVQTIESLRDIVWFLDPTSDNMPELVLRMKECARSMLPGIPFEFHSQGESLATNPSLNLRRNVFLMYKEILHNVAKHARAKRVQISINANPHRFQLEVADDGVGFDEARVQGGNGLKNLHRRAAGPPCGWPRPSREHGNVQPPSAC